MGDSLGLFNLGMFVYRKRYTLQHLDSALKKELEVLYTLMPFVFFFLLSLDLDDLGEAWGKGAHMSC